MDPITALKTLHITAISLLLPYHGHQPFAAERCGACQRFCQGKDGRRCNGSEPPAAASSAVCLDIDGPVPGDSAVYRLVAGASGGSVARPDLDTRQQPDLYPRDLQLGVAGRQAQPVATRRRRGQRAIHAGAGRRQRARPCRNCRLDGVQTGLSRAPYLRRVITGQPRLSASARRRGSGSTATGLATCSSKGRSFIESL
ncbi:MAG: hypothetical protein K0R45_3157 [Pseudomonas sp.]|nr:hypothetical protein [Pseudomonas sp.]